MPIHLKTSNEIAQDEHDTNTSPETKRVSIYGWDPVNLQKKRIVVSEDGTLQLEIPASDIEDLTEQVAHLVNNLNFLKSLQEPNGSLRVTMNSNTTGALTSVGTVTNVTTVATVTTLTGQTNIGGFAASHMIMSQMNTSVQAGIRANIAVS